MDRQEEQYNRADVAAVLMGISHVTEKMALSLVKQQENEQKGEHQNETVKRRIIITCR